MKFHISYKFCSNNLNLIKSDTNVNHGFWKVTTISKCIKSKCVKEKTHSQSIPLHLQHLHQWSVTVRCIFAKYYIQWCWWLGPGGRVLRHRREFLSHKWVIWIIKLGLLVVFHQGSYYSTDFRDCTKWPPIAYLVCLSWEKYTINKILFQKFVSLHFSYQWQIQNTNLFF